MSLIQKVLFFTIFMVIDFFVMLNIARDHGKAKYNEGYSVAMAECHQSVVNAQNTVLGAPKASRDDAEFINQVKIGDW